MASFAYYIDYTYKNFDGTIVEVHVCCESMDVVKCVLSDVSDVGILVNFSFHESPRQLR